MTPDPAKKAPAPSAQNSEIALLWRRYLACRDNRSHDQLLRAVDRLIRHEARRMLVSHPYLAEEAAQETLLGIERKIGSLEAPDYPAAFIRKVLSNKISTILQRESRRRAREERNWSPEVPDENITTSTEWHEFLGTLRTAVNDDEFWTLVLHYHFDFSYDEIGELLEKEAGTIRQIALRGRRKCRQRLSQLEGRVPAWFGIPEEADQPWRLKDPSDGLSPEPSPTAQTEPAAFSETTTQPGLTDPPPDIAARKAGEWGQDISDSADGLRRASIGSDSSAPREPETTSRRFGQLTVHVGTATSRLGGVGRRWLYTAPSSVLPLVVLVAVPALAFFPDADASAVIQPVTSSEPTGPTATTPQSSVVTAGGGSAGADRAGRQDAVERPINPSPTGPGQFPTTETVQTGTPTPLPADQPATTNNAGSESTNTPATFFDQAVPPSGPALPVPTSEPVAPAEPTDQSGAPTTNTPSPDAAPAPDTVPTTAAPATTPQATTAPPTSPTTTAAPTTAAPTTRRTTTTAESTTLRTTTTASPTTQRATTTTRQTTTTAAPTTTTVPTTTTTLPTTTAPTTTEASTTSQATTTTAATTTQPTTTTTQPTTTLQTTTTTEPPATSTSEPSPAF